MSEWCIIVTSANMFVSSVQHVDRKGLGIGWRMLDGTQPLHLIGILLTLIVAISLRRFAASRLFDLWCIIDGIHVL